MRRSDQNGPEQRIGDARAICDNSGFMCWHSELVRQWDGMWVLPRFLDKRNPQDFVRAVPDNQLIDHPRPEQPDVFETILARFDVSVFDGDGVMS